MVGKLKNYGSLRKYSYVSVTFYPFSYHTQSGRLTCYHAAEINISYDLPSPGTAEALQVEESRWDNLADEKASKLFVNYESMRELYWSKRGAKSPLEAKFPGQNLDSKT